MVQPIDQAIGAVLARRVDASDSRPDPTECVRGCYDSHFTAPPDILGGARPSVCLVKNFGG